MLSSTTTSPSDKSKWQIYFELTHGNHLDTILSKASYFPDGSLDVVASFTNCLSSNDIKINPIEIYETSHPDIPDNMIEDCRNLLISRFSFLKQEHDYHLERVKRHSMHDQLPNNFHELDDAINNAIYTARSKIAIFQQLFPECVFVDSESFLHRIEIETKRDFKTYYNKAYIARVLDGDSFETCIVKDIFNYSAALIDNINAYIDAIKRIIHNELISNPLHKFVTDNNNKDIFNSLVSCTLMKYFNNLYLTDINACMTFIDEFHSLDKSLLLIAFISHAVNNNDMSIAKHLASMVTTSDYQINAWVLSTQSPDIIRFLFNNNCCWISDGIMLALRNQRVASASVDDHVALIKFLLEKRMISPQGKTITFNEFSEAERLLLAYNEFGIISQVNVSLAEFCTHQTRLTRLEQLGCRIICDGKIGSEMPAMEYTPFSICFLGLLLMSKAGNAMSKGNINIVLESRQQFTPISQSFVQFITSNVVTEINIPFSEDSMYYGIMLLLGPDMIEPLLASTFLQKIIATCYLKSASISTNKLLLACMSHRHSMMIFAGKCFSFRRILNHYFINEYSPDNNKFQIAVDRAKSLDKEFREFFQLLYPEVDLTREDNYISEAQAERFMLVKLLKMFPHLKCNILSAMLADLKNHNCNTLFQDMRLFDLPCLYPFQKAIRFCVALAENNISKAADIINWGIDVYANKFSMKMSYQFRLEADKIADVLRHQPREQWYIFNIEIDMLKQFIRQANNLQSRCFEKLAVMQLDNHATGRLSHELNEEFSIIKNNY